MADITPIRRKTVPLTVELVALGREVAHCHEQVRASLASALEHALQAGDALIRAKQLVRHGEWQSWLREHGGMSVRVAQEYAFLSKRRERLGDLTQIASVRQALGILRDVNASEPPGSPPDPHASERPHISAQSAPEPPSEGAISLVRPAPEPPAERPKAQRAALLPVRRSQPQPNDNDWPQIPDPRAESAAARRRVIVATVRAWIAEDGEAAVRAAVAEAMGDSSESLQYH
jgi:hypothetical protein